MHNATAAFIMPHWTRDFAASRSSLECAVEGIFAQTDARWNLIIVDDCSSCPEAKQYLRDLEQAHPERIRIIWNETNSGPGQSRNAGVRLARQMRAPFVLFNDADDVSHPQRLQTVRDILEAKPEVDVVYSSFEVIDEHGTYVDPMKLTPSILEILESHQNNPISGSHVWVDMGTRKGYTNITSATAVRTELASRYPFPQESVSEDFYAWMQYAAGGNDYYFAETIPSVYRIPQQVASASRARVANFYEEKARVDESGFTSALQIAQTRDAAFRNPELVEELLISFHLKLAETLYRERQLELSLRQLGKAQQISQSKYEVFKKNCGFRLPDHVSL